MPTPILTTKLYIPSTRSNVVTRPRLIERLNKGLLAGRKLTLISAPAGFGKTTLASEWVAGCERLEPKVRAAWLSLDEGDSDPTHFLTYLVAALQTIAANIGGGVLGHLQSPQPPPIELILTTLVNEITNIPDQFVLVLDDYHLVDAKSVDNALDFLLEHLPPQMHLVITTREDPQLPLSRLRVQGQLTELRATDLRFIPSEAAEFLNQVMSLNLSVEDIAALETRTEGWIAGMQLAAISMQGHPDTTRFIKSFTGSHRFVMDYLVEQVLEQQSPSIQNFLLRTSILDRLCGPLCDAVLLRDADLHPASPASGQTTLEYLERANLFIVPLDDERRWYRYHHLFADLLRQRLLQQVHQSAASSIGDEGKSIAELHTRASQWYEDNGLEIDAFHHAVAANDVERAARLVEGKGMPLQFRGAVTAILDWLESLPTTVLNTRPFLWWRYASLLLITGQANRAEEKLEAAEAALHGSETDDKARDLVGQIAAARAALAIGRYRAETALVQSRRALEYLHPNNLSSRASANWSLGFAYFSQGDRATARQALTEAVALGQASGDVFTTILSTIGLGQIQQLDNQLFLAAETFQHVLQLAGEQPLQVVSEAQLGLARIFYEWNDLGAAEKHGQQSLDLARQFDGTIDRFIICEVFLARLRLSRGDVTGAAAMLTQANQSARQNNFLQRLPEIAAVQILTLIQQGNLTEAGRLAQTYDLPISQARVFLAQGDPSAAMTLLVPYRQQMEAKGWQDQRLKVMILQAVAHVAHGERDEALKLLSETLAIAAPGGFIRSFVDEGQPMRSMIYDLSFKIQNQTLAEYAGRLLAAFPAVQSQPSPKSENAKPKFSIPEPLSPRELEVLRLIAAGLSNREISERLYLALSTVKGHSRIIFDKLQVQRRTEAVARARELGLL